MKLSELILWLAEMEKLSYDTDPEVTVMLDDLRLEFRNATLNMDATVNMTRGNLSVMPEWIAELTIDMVEDGT